MMTFESNIDKFYKYFAHQAIVLRAISLDYEQLEGTGPEDHQLRFYQKCLIVGALDTLAALKFPKDTFPDLHRRNRERFVRFISEFSSWNHGNLINVPFLYDHLNSTNGKNSKLANYLRKKLNQFDPHSGIDLSPDQIDEIPENLFPMAICEMEVEAIRFNQHYNLLYRYRNFLVHESREPGHAMEGIKDGEDSAYYHGYINEDKWFLAYPVEMFFRLFETSVDKLRDYFIEQQIDPFYSINDTTRW